ncbi:HET-domain-containing protein [Lojkania enalia]|uniref:HET-domain-containing protein n=1 Tax=Lojkania enalia TaxID=147567 RepID=A0A9P4KFL2_9PLEO|nr:HET-domain-containing protein [Didymosphaeria enalia]
MALRSRPTSPEIAEGRDGNKRQKIAPPSQLCGPCRTLKFDRSFRKAFKYYGGPGGIFLRKKTIKRPERTGLPLYYEDYFHVHDFKDRLAKPSECPLCTFFRSMMVDPGRYMNYKLLAFCSSESAFFCLPRLQKSSICEKVNDTIFMAVVPDIPSIPRNGCEEHWLEKGIPAAGLIYRVLADATVDANETLLNARQLSYKVDFSIPREWLSYCNEHHDVCKPKTQHGSVDQWFRVINCELDSPEVEEQPWGVEYAALSYVWGRGMEDWPKTVLDAVHVTKEMGLRWLWVDRLCINQEDQVEKDYLISRMTTIYSEAAFTIVAAAGSGADCGLPGVRSTPRKLQPKYELDSSNILISTLLDPRLEICNSVWSTRGWTYQEGILSNRRLVFTDHQAYWECKCMSIHEAVRLPLDLVHESSRLHMADFMRGGIFKSVSYNGGARNHEEVQISDDSDILDYGFTISKDQPLSAKLRGLQEHIRAFSSRNLSSDGDSLRAFQGITGLYGLESNIFPFLGLPMWLGEVAGGQLGAQMTLALSLCFWYHRSDSDLHMFASEQCQRRTHLPSWTWAGWKGTVSWRLPPHEEHSRTMCDLVESEFIDLLWAADIYLRDKNSSASVHLASIDSPHSLDNEDLRLLEIKKPWVLKHFDCIPDNYHQWAWLRKAGRSLDKKYNAGPVSWNSDFYRIRGRLTFIGVSISITRAEWTGKHKSGEFKSVLLFAGRDPSGNHGRARFLTLRRMQEGDEIWERIGIIQLIIPDGVDSEPNGELSRYKSSKQLFEALPIQQRPWPLVIQ